MNIPYGVWGISKSKSSFFYAMISMAAYFLAVIIMPFRFSFRSVAGGQFSCSTNLLLSVFGCSGFLFEKYESMKVFGENPHSTFRPLIS